MNKLEFRKIGKSENLKSTYVEILLKGKLIANGWLPKGNKELDVKIIKMKKFNKFLRYMLQDRLLVRKVEFNPLKKERVVFYFNYKLTF